MQLSASKRVNLDGPTTLEMQAQNIVQEDDEDDVEITDEAKYNALVEKRKDRRAVSIGFIF